MKATSEEERWVGEFLRQRRLQELQEHILKQAFADEGRMERVRGPQSEIEWIRVNGEDIGGPDDEQGALDGLQALEALHQERPPLVQRESEHLYTLTPPGRGAARAKRRRRP